MSSTTPHPSATLLHRRAADLRALATAIERSPVMRVLDLAEEASPDGWHGDRAELCERMLAGDLHRLHLAAEQLRQTAFRLAARAVQLGSPDELSGVA
jgi:hypothetical protein